ncbi:alpha/beta fold hydrolase [Maribacter aestuarii]|uniref:alpha/beta fold hydrolase n=1 Tax=Maribacter aestuarii TaxID=1130723 RepID=UPI00248CC6E0|nr:alpha/beta hydrolase [Maribacter aestuarii]
MKTIQNLSILVFLIFSNILISQERPFDVKVVGTGDPILLFPGFTCTDTVWEDTVAELSKNNECHLFTLAGFGEVEPIEGPWLPKVMEGISEYIDTNKLENATLIGHSLGGTLGLWLATEENKNFKKVIVVDALPSIGALMIPNFKSENVVYDNSYNEQLLAMGESDFKAMAEQMAKGMTMNAEKRPQLVNWMMQADRKTYVYGYTDLLKLDLREDLARIKTPVVILAATLPYGRDMVKSTYEIQYKNLSNYQIEYADDAAHFIMYDNPEWFMEKVLESLK